MKKIFIVLCLVPFLSSAQASGIDFELNCHIPGTTQVTPCRILKKELAAKNLSCFKTIYGELAENIDDYVDVQDHRNIFTLGQYVSFYGRKPEGNGGAVSYYFIHGDCNYYDAESVTEEAAPVKIDSDILCSYNYSLRTCQSLKEFQENSLCVKTTEANYEKKMKRFLGKNFVAFTTFESWTKFGKKVVTFRRADGTGRLSNLVPLCGQ